MSNIIYGLIIILSFTGFSAGMCVGEVDCNCWDTCIRRAYLNETKEYLHLGQIIETVRKARQIHRTPYTVFAIDRSVGDEIAWEYQKYLATLIALTLPVNEICNPPTVISYDSIYGWLINEWQCEDRCFYVDVFRNFPSYPIQTSPPASGDFLGGACAIGISALCNNNYKLALDPVLSGSRKLLISIENSPISPILFDQCLYYKAIVSIKTSPSLLSNQPDLQSCPGSSGASMNVSTSQNYFEIFTSPQQPDRNNLEALKRMVNCMTVSCCTDRKASVVDDKTVSIKFIEVGSKGPKSIVTTEKEFMKNASEKAKEKAKAGKGKGQGVKEHIGSKGKEKKNN